MRSKMKKEEILSHLEGISGWELLFEDQVFKLHRHIVFSNFSEAWAFMNRVALLAEKLNHHPNWSNVYKKVDVTLFTHDVGGISSLDIEMVKQINSFLDS